MLGIPGTLYLFRAESSTRSWMSLASRTRWGRPCLWLYALGGLREAPRLGGPSRSSHKGGSGAILLHARFNVRVGRL